MNPAALNAVTQLLGVAIEVLLTDPFYRDILLSMQSEGRSKPTPEERAAIDERLRNAMAGLDAAIAQKQG